MNDVDDRAVGRTAGRLTGGLAHDAVADVDAQIAALRLETDRIVDGVLAGLHRSPRLGSSVVFVEHREYRPGDDPRLLDWRAYARNDRHVVRRFEQETELDVHLWLDASASMRFGEGSQEKLRFGATLLAVFATLAANQGDPVGAARFDRGIRKVLPPRSSPAHRDEILAVLAEPAESGAGTSLEALAELVSQTVRRGLIFVASDLVDFDEGALQPLEVAARSGHDVRVFQILHRDEIDLSGDGPFRFEGLEGEPTVDADPAVVRAAYRDELDRYVERVRQRLFDAGGWHRLVPTDASLADVVLETLLEASPGRRRGGARWA